MEHSIAARYATRAAARFPRPSSASRRPHLGLVPVRAFRPAPTRLTVLLRDQPSPVAHLRRDPRSITATRPVRHSTGRLRPAFSLTWQRSPAPRRSSAPAAPWRA
ncbi:MAG TPA: hypothetical protein VNL94_03700 [Candidatus Binatia bacterium]|nr:hypothetical protein [Candidatus Binatia bacterium]